MRKLFMAGTSVALMVLCGGAGWISHQYYQDIDQMCNAWLEDGVFQNGKAPEPVVEAPVVTPPLPMGAPTAPTPPPLARTYESPRILQGGRVYPESQSAYPGWLGIDR